MSRKSQKQRAEYLVLALQRIIDATAIPAAKRADLDWLRSACSLAHGYARSALAPEPELFPEDPA